MKDALGHGSNGTGRGQYLTPAGRSVMPSRPFREGAPAEPAAQSDTHRTVFGLRQRLAETPSAGHARVLMQGIRNLLGG